MLYPFLLLIFWTIDMMVWSWDARPASSTLHVGLFEIPPVQNYVKEWKEAGVPKIIRKGGDVSYQLPDKGLVFRTKARTSVTEEIIKTLRLRYPETEIGNDLEVRCVLNESILISAAGQTDKIVRKIDDKKKNYYVLEIEPQIQAAPPEHRARIRLSVKMDSKETDVINSDFEWNASQQLYIGFPSHLGQGRKGFIYFLTLFVESSG